MRFPALRLATVALLLPASLVAQSPSQLAKAGNLITPAKVLQRIGVLAHDSMGGRNTPSPGLEKSAQFLADSYKAWGLKPAGENGTYFQRYPMAKKGIDATASFFESNEGGVVTRYPFNAQTFGTGATEKPVTSHAMLIGGTVTPADIESATGIEGAVVLLVVDAGKAAAWRNVSRAVALKKPAAIIMLTNQDSVMFGRIRDASGTSRFAVEMPNAPRPIPTITIHDKAFNATGGANRPDWDAMRAAPAALIQTAPPEVSVTVFIKETVLERVMVPNVVAMVEGSDPVLKNEYVVYSSHFDHVGTVGDGVGGCGALTRPDGSVDNICNGADDDASGTTGLMMVAEAWAKLDKKPRRSMIILNVSGEEKGLLGSAWYAEHPTVSAEKIVTNVNFDMIGRNNPDSIVVIGKEHSNLGETLAKVQAAHPELKLIAADDIWPEQNFYARSDHFNFARKGVPVLFFFNGVHEQYHRPNDEVPLIDTSKLARVAKLGFYFGVDVANSPTRPVWNAESYKTIVVEQKIPQPVKRTP